MRYGITYSKLRGQAEPKLGVPVTFDVVGLPELVEVLSMHLGHVFYVRRPLPIDDAKPFQVMCVEHR